MYKLKKLDCVDKNAKIPHAIVLGIEVLLSIVSLGLLIYIMAIGDPDNRFLSAFGSIIVFLAPFLVELIFKVRFSTMLHSIFIVHLTFSMLFGCVLNMHNTVGPFDEIAHVLFGYLACLYILYLCFSWKNYKNQSPLFMATIILFISLGTATLWELMEFTVDIFAGQTSLGHPLEEVLNQGIALGYSGIALNLYTLQNGVLIWDTITDMALHLLGSMLFFVQYLVAMRIKRPLFIKTFEHDFYATRNNFFEKVEPKKKQNNGEDIAIQLDDETC